MSCEALRNRDDRSAQLGRNTQCDTAPQSFGIVAPAVHGKEMRDAGSARRPGSVHCHREFMAVSQRDMMVPKNRLE